MVDPYNLQRFVDAQRSISENVRRELRSGSKTKPLDVVYFPTVKGSGRSNMAQLFAISSREEAAAYLEHPVLGARLRECSRLWLPLMADRSKIFSAIPAT